MVSICTRYSKNKYGNYSQLTSYCPRLDEEEIVNITAL